MFSVPRSSFEKMICAQFEVGKSILIPCSAYKFEEFAGDPDFCALVFDVGQQTIKPCIPETNNPILYVETQSLMQILITQSKMAALYAFFSPFFQDQSEQPTYYLKTLSKLILTNIRLGGVKPAQFNIEPDGSLYLLQLFFLLTHPIANKFRFVFTPKGGTREFIETDKYADLGLSCMKTLRNQGLGVAFHDNFQSYVRDSYNIPPDLQDVIKKLTDK
jgi:hypothetical protein